MTHPEEPTRAAITIVDADSRWPDQFDHLRRSIAPAFTGVAVRFEHVGSTAVPGLAAKPIIDLVVVVPAASDIPDAIARLRLLGYEHEGDLGVPGREAFRGPSADPAHHLYLSPADGASLAAHVRFRDRLRADPELAAAYAELKRRLAAAHPYHRAAYVAGKTTFIEAVLRS